MPSPDYPGYNTTLVPQPGVWAQSGEATDGLDAGLRPSRLSTARPPPPPRQGALAAMAGSQYSSDRAASGTAAGKAGIPTDFSPDSVRILVVDDDQVCLRTVEKMLRQCYARGAKGGHCRRQGGSFCAPGRRPIISAHFASSAGSITLDPPWPASAYSTLPRCCDTRAGRPCRAFAVRCGRAR